MYLLTRKQLKELLRDEQIYRQFTFSEKELEILQLLSKGYKLQEIGKLYGVTRQRIHQVYRNAMQKMYKKMMEVFRENRNNT